VCDVLSSSLDAALAELGAAMRPGAAVVALGGYGRMEQCLWSDVDVMILHEHDDPEPLVRSVLYPLWDAGLKVGHAVRTVAENRQAGSDLETLTSLLSARLVTGDAELFEKLITVVTDMVRKRPLASSLVHQERQRRALEPYPTMTADVKEGRGALRTHQGFWWERRRAELLGLPVDVPSDEEDAARASLLSIRNSLHSAAGRASERFVVDLRAGAAAWLETDVHSIAADLTAALHIGDRLADRRWPDLHAEQDPMIGYGRRVFGAIRSRFSKSAEDEEPSDEVLALAVMAAGRREGVWFTQEEEATVRNAPVEPWTESDRAAFVKLLSAGARGRTVFGRLEEFGWVRREFPEWEVVATAPQLAPFHDHPVGTHLWRAADEMRALIDGGGETGEIADEVGSTEELLLAAFLHDIGKARGGNHALVGAELAAGFMRRTGFGAATIGVVVDAVRHHLLLSEAATRRDIADLAVIDEVASLVGDIHQLDVLYLLTIADLRATGTTMWNDWRASLLERLYRSVRVAIEAGGAAPATPSVDAIMDQASIGVDRRHVEEHVAAMPAGYLDSTTPGDVLWHLEVAQDLEGPALIAVDGEDPGRVLVVGSDRSGFLLTVSRVFTANGVGVMDARFRTRTDGIAFDTFRVCNDQTGAPVAANKWDKVSDDLVAALVENRDVRGELRERARVYQQPGLDRRAVRVRTGVSGRFTQVEIKAPDRIGLLADIAEALYGEGLDIYLARIDTMGGEARDTFYVRRMGGVALRDEAELAGLRGRLADRLRG
jgi:[protein-PII] uridylyltransferase